jgi:hypothetical protein
MDFSVLFSFQRKEALQVFLCFPFIIRCTQKKEVLLFKINVILRFVWSWESAHKDPRIINVALKELDTERLTVNCMIGFEALTALVMKSSIFWNKTLCSSLKLSRRFGGTYCLHLQGRRIYQTREQCEAGSNQPCLLPDSRWFNVPPKRRLTLNALHGLIYPNDGILCVERYDDYKWWTGQDENGNNCDLLLVVSVAFVWTD